MWTQSDAPERQTSFSNFSFVAVVKQAEIMLEPALFDDCKSSINMPPATPPDKC